MEIELILNHLENSTTALPAAVQSGQEEMLINKGFLHSLAGSGVCNLNSHENLDVAFFTQLSSRNSKEKSDKNNKLNPL